MKSLELALEESRIKVQLSEMKLEQALRDIETLKTQFEEGNISLDQVSEEQTFEDIREIREMQTPKKLKQEPV